MSAAGQGTFRVPQLSDDDFSTFFETHFSNEVVKAFHSQFFNPSQGALEHGLPEGCANDQAAPALGEEDDGLGYYPDGVKRTLTDEQIEIFRHSELHAIEREKEKEEERRKLEELTPSAAAAPSDNHYDDATDAGGLGGSEEGEAQGEPQDQVQTTSANKKKRKRKGKNGNQPKEQKPDLRKRTWDVVETGLDSLDYD
ncbi:uncharacterized protein DNG_10383 [Cephalotrichum gorgonifer]|uniref:Uncharacterized protein n=1 Tax=Cephalotrichum gorgonifer TaxID=2041049 RepID=A0AAE8N8Z3_9PEZI|nr:uncharacterized protein DNG_10383 [Cephalotrichum gorgonifer]